MEPNLESERAQGRPSAIETKRVSFRRRQLHFWIGEREYQFLCSLAEIEEEPLSSLLRRLIRQHMLQKRTVA
jgi:hypothetical protein